MLLGRGAFAMPGAYMVITAPFLQNPKASKPWIFLDLHLPPRQVEVNVHPTKKEVGFLHQDLVIDAICQHLEQTLIASMDSRTFAVARPMLTSQLQEPAPTSGAAASTGGPRGGEDAVGGERGEEGDVGDAEEEEEKKVRRGLRRSSSSQKQSQQQQLPVLRQNSSQSGGSGATAAAAIASQRPDKLIRTDAKAQSITSFLVKRPAAAALAAVGGGGRAAAGPAVPSRKRRATGAGAQDGGSFGRRLEGDGGIADEDDEGLGLGGWNITSMREGEMVAAAAAAAAAEEQLGVGTGEQGTATASAGAAQAGRRGALPAALTEDKGALQLLQEVQQECHPGLAQLFKEHIWVGMVSVSKGSLGRVEYCFGASNIRAMGMKSADRISIGWPRI
jgi:DNA mismatch repair protein MLH1